MKKLVVVGFVFGVIGFIAGNAFWYLASPLWIDVAVSEDVSTDATQTVVARGTFTDTDKLHRGKGVATVYQGVNGGYLLRLTEFEVTNGPDLEVWLVSNADIKKADDVVNSEYVALGQLKGNIGDQNYRIPSDTDLDTFGSVVIWCEQFSVLFSPATLLRS